MNRHSEIHTSDSVEDALRTFPQAEPPPGLSGAVMARVRGLAPPPRFRLAWLDYALALFVTAMGAVALALWQSMPPAAAQVAESRLLALAWRLAASGPLALGGLALAAVAAAAAAMLLGLTLSHSTARLR
jgi:hypothetical protein